jgi:hypothetical protein
MRAGVALSSVLLVLVPYGYARFKVSGAVGTRMGEPGFLELDSPACYVSTSIFYFTFAFVDTGSDFAGDLPLACCVVVAFPLSGRIARLPRSKTFSIPQCPASR